MAESDLEAEIDRLYGLPLAEFIGERNALAKRLRAGGDRLSADAVKALAKPTVTAWAVNALVHQERPRFDQLRAAAATLRAALAGQGNRKQAEAERRAALRSLVGRATELLTAAGHAAPPQSRQRISHTLEALAAHDPQTEGPLPGRLTTDLEPPGFDALADLAASLAPAAPTARDAGKGKRAKAGTEAADRDRQLAAAQRDLAQRQTELKTLEQQTETARRAAEEAEERHRRLLEEASAAERAARAAAEAAAAAKKELAEARAAAGRAKTARRRGLARVAAACRRLERRQDRAAKPAPD